MSMEDTRLQAQLASEIQIWESQERFRKFRTALRHPFNSVKDFSLKAFIAGMPRPRDFWWAVRPRKFLGYLCFSHPLFLTMKTAFVVSGMDPEKAERMTFGILVPPLAAMALFTAGAVKLTPAAPVAAQAGAAMKVGADKVEEEKVGPVTPLDQAMSTPEMRANMDKIQAEFQKQLVVVERQPEKMVEYVPMGGKMAIPGDGGLMETAGKYRDTVIEKQELFTKVAIKASAQVAEEVFEKGLPKAPDRSKNKMQSPIIRDKKSSRVPGWMRTQITDEDLDIRLIDVPIKIIPPDNDNQPLSFEGTISLDRFATTPTYTFSMRLYSTERRRNLATFDSPKYLYHGVADMIVSSMDKMAAQVSNLYRSLPAEERVQTRYWGMRGAINHDELESLQNIQEYLSTEIHKESAVKEQLERVSDLKAQWRAQWRR